MCGVPGWSLWGEWSSCSATCSVGRRLRERSCAVEGRCGDEASSEEQGETSLHLCSSQLLKAEATAGCFRDVPCSSWGAWGWLSGCSESCGGGTRARERPCEGAEAACGEEEEGRETRPCNEAACEEQACPRDFVRVGNACYRRGPEGSWAEAEGWCEGVGSELAGVFDSRELCLLSDADGLDLEGGAWGGSLGTNMVAVLRTTGGVALAEAVEKDGTRAALCRSGLGDGACWEGWEQSGGRCLRLFASAPLDWAGAAEQCAKAGASLASFDDLADFEKLMKGATREAWIGLKMTSEGPEFFADLAAIDALAALDSVNQASAGSCFAISNSESGPAIASKACAERLPFVCHMTKPKSERTYGSNGNCVPDDGSWYQRVSAPEWTPDRPECPAGWTFKQGETEKCSCVRAVSEPADLAEAEKRCKEFGGDSQFSSLTPASVAAMGLLSDGAFWAGRGLGSEEGWNASLPPAAVSSPALRCQWVEGGSEGASLRLGSCANRLGFVCQHAVSCTVPTTPKPYPTMDPVAKMKGWKVVATVVQTVGCTFVVGVLASTVAAFLFIRNWSLERVLNMSQEVSLLGAHLLIMSAKDNHGNDLACAVVGIALHYFFLVHFLFLLLEALHVYTVVTAVTNDGLLSRLKVAALGWGAPAVAVGLTAAVHGGAYVTPVMCLLDLTGPAAKPVMLPILGLVVLAVIVTEAVGMDVERYPLSAGAEESRLTTCRVAGSGLAVLIPLSAAGWLLSLFSISGQRLSLFTVSFAVNISLAVALFLFHALANPLVRSLFVVIYRRLKNCFCPGKWRRVEDGSFASDFLDHDFDIYQKW